MIRTRLTLTLILALMLVAAGALAQQTATATDTAAAPARDSASLTATAAEMPVQAQPAAESVAEEAPRQLSSYEVRGEFSQLLRHHPPELATVLAADPTLLSNEGYLSGYPEVARFVAVHPEIQRSPRFYLAEFAEQRVVPESPWNDLMEGFAIFGTLGLITFALGWLIRTIVEQKRWNRLSKTQTEVHNKILDRFGTSEELLQYVRSPAGSKFLESAPIPVRTAPAVPRARQTPTTRILWSFQVGAGVAVGAAGMLLLSLRFSGETAEGLFAMGAIAFCVGAGFIASAVVSLALSRRLGLFAEAEPPAAIDEAGGVR